MSQESYESSYLAKGTFLAFGASGIVELLADNRVVKSPWPGEEHAQSIRDIALEAKIYQRIFAKVGAHERFLTQVNFDETNSTLTLDYMPQGTLRDYLQASNSQITQQQRRQWALAAAEGLALLHSIGILHCDFTPKNMLLDRDMTLKIADFGCSSIDSQPPSGGGSARFYPVIPNWPSNWLPEHDIFALGSTLYEIFTGRQPFHDCTSGQAEARFKGHEQPSLEGVDMREIIAECWTFGARDAAAMHQKIAAVPRLQMDPQS